MDSKLFSSDCTNYRVLSIYLNLVLILFLFFLTLTPKIDKILLIIPDDAGYYFKIAENFANTGKLTFDGFVDTNGFQPLWMIFILPVFYFFKTQPENKAVIILILQLLMSFVSVKILLSRIKTVYHSTALQIVLILFCIFVSIRNVTAMETSLMFFLYTFFLCYALEKKFGLPKSRINHFILGLLSGLIVLARLDQIFFVTSLAIFLLLTNLKPFRIRFTDACKYISGFLLVFTPYIIFNLFYFKSFMPISGMLKSSFPHIIDISKNFALFYNAITTYKVNLIAALIIIVFPLWKLFAKYKKIESRNRTFSILISVFYFSILSHALHSILFMKWGVFNWHIAFYSYCAVLMLLDPVDYLFTTVKFSKILVVIVLFSAALGGIYFGLIKRVDADEKNAFHIQSYYAAKWAKQNSDKSTVFAMSDAGFFSFFSERRVINLDGLVNDMNFQEVLKNNHLKSYLKEHKVEYIVQHAIWDRKDILTREYKEFSKYCRANLYQQAGDSILVTKKAEVYRSAPYLDGSYKTVFLIWRIE